MFYPIHTANLNALKAMGRSDYYLNLEIFKKIVGAVILIATIWFGPLVMCASGILASFLSQVINAWPNKKLLDYSLFEQYKDIVPSILLSLVMGICVYLIGILLPIPTVLLLLVQVLIGGAVYIGLSVVFKIDTFYYILKLVKSLKNR
jgi:O-antigen/teichoic acid export membrane protein